MGKLLQRRRRGAVEHAPRQQSGEQIDGGRDRCVATREVEYRYEGNCCERIGRSDQLGRVPREHERGGERDDQDAAAEVRLVPVRVWTLGNTTANSAVMPAANAGQGEQDALGPRRIPGPELDEKTHDKSYGDLITDLIKLPRNIGPGRAQLDMYSRRQPREIGS